MAPVGCLLPWPICWQDSVAMADTLTGGPRVPLEEKLDGAIVRVKKQKKPTFDLFWYVRSDLGVTMPGKRRLASSSHDIVNMRPPKQRSFSSANSTHGQPRPSSDPSCRIEHLHAWLGSLHALRSCRPRERMRLKHLLRRADDMLMRRSAGRDLG